MIIPELLKIYEENTDELGLPIFDKPRWQMLVNQYINPDKSLPMSKQAKDMIDTMIEFFKIHKPQFPFREFEETKLRGLFNELGSLDLRENIYPRTKCHTVHEKYPDYIGNWNDYGLGVLNFSANYNAISDMFMNRERLKCGYGKEGATLPGPIEMWEKQTDLKQMLSPIWRLHPKTDSALKRLIYMEGVRVGAYIATQFKPAVAKAFYDMTKATKVLDTSSGWGDRMTGFFCSNAEEYWGMDPNGDLHETYHKMAKQYELWLGCEEPKSNFGDNWFSIEGKKKVKIYRSPAEDVPWNEIPNDIDIMFSSPPYFATEKYAEGNKFEEDQSWSKYHSYEEWRDGFYLPVMEQSFLHLKPGGWLMVNIMDAKIKGKRYKCCDDLVNFMMNKYEGSFIGQIGMRIMARPKSLKSFEGNTPEEKKKKYDEWMDKWFLESVWAFQKPGGDSDLFAPYCDTSLESFFG